MTDGVDLFTGENAFHLSFDHGELTLMGGNREYKPIMSWNPEIGTADSIGFFVSPGALISLDWISLEYPGALQNSEISGYGDKDILDSYLKRSEDPLEGIWKVFDRTLDEDYLRMGGDYSLALIRSPQGYNIYYLEGAQTLRGDWKPGMLKARLIESGFPGIYDVEWLDAAGSPVPNEIKARFESPLLTIIFPYQSSTLRLRKL